MPENEHNNDGSLTAGERAASNNNNSDNNESLTEGNSNSNDSNNDSNIDNTGDNNNSNSSGQATNSTAISSRLQTVQNRLLSQQRSNILLQALFHHMVHSSLRRREQAEEALALNSNPPPLPDREMPVLSHEEAIATNAICRFCFEGSILPAEDNDSNDDTMGAGASTSSIDESNRQNVNITTKKKKKKKTSNALVAPCNCDGGSRWVHLECLRQWQRMQARSVSRRHLMDDTSDGSAATATTTTTSTTYTTAGYVCNVCNSPYLSRPPSIRSVRSQYLRRGTLLVAKSHHGGRTFQHTVILLLTDVCGNPNGTFGLIVNAPLKEESRPSNELLIPLQGGSMLQGNEETQEQNDSTENDIDRQNNNGSNNTNSVTISNVDLEWRRGGPVCGGRLGVVHYSVLHTYPSAFIWDGDRQDDILDVDIDEDYVDDDEDEENDNPSNDDAGSNRDDRSRADDNENETDIGDIEAPAHADTNQPLELGDDGNEGNNDGNDNGTPEDEDENDNAEVDENNDNVCNDPLSLPVFDVHRNTPPLQFVASPDSPMPSTFPEETLTQTLQRLVTSHNTTNLNTENAGSDNLEANHVTTINPSAIDTNETETASPANTNRGGCKLIVFSGYCKWRAGQLEREIQREVWDVCIDATPADILRHPDSGFWQEITESDRLLSWQGLLEDEEEEGAEDD